MTESQILDPKDFPLVYATTEGIFKSFLEQCVAQRIDMDRFKWTGPQLPLIALSDRRDCVFLRLRLGSEDETFDFALTWAFGRDWRVKAQEEADGLRKELVLGKTEQPWEAAWTQVRFMGQTLASFGLDGLLIAAQHPRLVPHIE